MFPWADIVFQLATNIGICSEFKKQKLTIHAVKAVSPSVPRKAGSVPSFWIRRCLSKLWVCAGLLFYATEAVP